MKRITDARNDIEHYCTTETPGRLRELIADSFFVVRDFLVTYLDAEPGEILGVDTWNILLKVADVYNAELAKCRERMALVQWKNRTLADASDLLRCNACGSELIEPTDPEADNPVLSTYRCSACGSEFQLDEHMIEGLLEEYFGAELYLCASQGGQPPITYCIDCGTQTFVYDEEQCVVCRNVYVDGD